MAKRKTKSIPLSKRTLDARPDAIDFRDRMFVPTLVEVPLERPLDAYREEGVPILNQGQEGSCTGFGLATVVHYLLRTRAVRPDEGPVSPRMLYEMAKRYDDWSGEDYEGSSARGAMKGWHKHGVCREQLWPYVAGRADRRLTNDRAADARERPLGAYFRVNHRDIVAMHTAIAEVGVLYATALVHSGWDRVNRRGIIPYPGEFEGGHAFAIVAFDRNGFWIQNSWSDDWGLDGYAQITYADWLENGTDVWVARLGAPVDVATRNATAAMNHDVAGKSFSYHAIRPHVISIGNNGALLESGTYGTSEDEVRSIIEDDFPRITAGWKKKHLLLYAHGGLVGADSAVQRLADLRQPLLDQQVYPLSFVWHSDFWTTLKNILRDALSRRRAEGLLDAAKDFMLDRVDDALEPLARMLTGLAQWNEMKENSLLATQSDNGGVRKTCKYLKQLLADDPGVELHLVGHSAGSIFHAPLIQYLTTSGRIRTGPMRGKSGLGLKVASCALWAPACTVELFKDAYVPSIEQGTVERFALFTMTDEAEQDDDCANIYHKSLLYLVSNAFEDKPRIPLFRDGVPILGMQKFVDADDDLTALFKKKQCDWVLSPNTAAAGSRNRSTARSHGAFDDDRPTLQATLARILDATRSRAGITLTPFTAASQQRRQQIERV